GSGFLTVVGAGLAADVRLLPESEDSLFLWQDMLRDRQFMLLSLRTGRYLGILPDSGGAYAANHAGARPDRRDGSALVCSQAPSPDHRSDPLTRRGAVRPWRPRTQAYNRAGRVASSPPARRLTGITPRVARHHHLAALMARWRPAGARVAVRLGVRDAARDGRRAPGPRPRRRDAAADVAGARGAVADAGTGRGFCRPCPLLRPGGIEDARGAGRPCPRPRRFQARWRCGQCDPVARGPAGRAGAGHQRVRRACPAPGAGTAERP